MTLGLPAALWLLAVLPVIVLLYMLRARRQDVPISSILLWQRARRDLLAHIPVRRLERSLLLLLQLLTATLVVLALARPQVALPAAGGLATVLVIDTSASMQATDVMPSRFEAARAAALAEVARNSGQVMVVEAGPQPRAVTGFVDDRTARDALLRLRPTDAPARLEQAVTMAVAQRAGGRGVRVVVFTDRGTALLPGVQYFIVGQTGRNVGLAGVRGDPTPQGTVAIVQVRNAGTLDERVPLTVSIDDRLVLERMVEVAPGATVAVPVRVAVSRGVLRAHLAPHDPLAVDDTGYAVIGAPPPRVLVVGEHDRALSEALWAVGASVRPGETPDAQTIASSDVVVLNRTPPFELPPGNYLLLGTTAANLPITADGAVRAPQVLRWSQAHPVLRYVDLHDLTIASALALRPRGGEVLAEGEVPLIWAYDGAGIRAIVLGFGLQESDLPLQIAFPILLRNALAWLVGTGGAYEAGDPLVVPAGSQLEAMLDGPEGSSTVLRARGGRFVVPVLERAGLYTLRFGGHTRRIAVNPAPSEFEITPIHPAAERTLSGPSQRTERPVELARALLVAVLVLLLLEWALWLRGLPRAGVTRFLGSPRPRPSMARLGWAPTVSRLRSGPAGARR